MNYHSIKEKELETTKDSLKRGLIGILDFIKF